jgi:hypothetical protein
MPDEINTQVFTEEEGREHLLKLQEEITELVKRHQLHCFIYAAGTSCDEISEGGVLANNALFGCAAHGLGLMARFLAYAPKPKDVFFFLQVLQDHFDERVKTVSDAVEEMQPTDAERNLMQMPLTVRTKN